MTNVLIACEESGIVRDAFRRLGANAISCDLQPAASDGPHVQGDVLDVLANPVEHFGGPIHGMIAHPPCTYLCSTQNRWMSGPPASGPKPGVLYGEDRRLAQKEAIAFVQQLLDADVPHIAVENPVGILSSAIRPANQYVQPWHHGDPFSKLTGLWLVNLPPLHQTALTGPQSDQLALLDELPATGPNGEDNRRQASWLMPPSPERSKLRSRTYPGIAAAMARQWLPIMAASS